MPTNPTKKDLLSDIRTVHASNTSGKTTRDYYQQHGSFSKGQILKHWPTFKAFLAEAEIENHSPVAAQPKPEKPHETETSEVSKDTWSVSMPKTRIHTLEALIEHYQVDLSIWEVDRFRCVKHEMGYTTGPKRTKVGAYEQLFNLRADFKRKKDIQAIKKEIAELIADAKIEAERPARINRPIETSGRMLEVNIPDIHFGKLAWAKETGFENYDTRIAEVVHDRAVDAIINRAVLAFGTFEEIVYVVGNDLLQADDKESQTTSGTIVTTDARYQKTFKVARRSVIRAIKKLREIARVRVVVVPGNHDSLSTWHLGESLDIYFHHYDDVTVDNEPVPRKFHEFGKVMLMFCHGHKGKRNDYPLQMATQQPGMFGRTKWRETHCGHSHQTKLDEQHGVRVRVLPALCPPDDWHSENGYTGNIRCAEAFVWHREEGLMSTIYYNDEAQPPVNTVYTTKVG